MKRRENPIFYRVRIFVTATAVLFAGGLATYVLFTDTGRADAFGEAFGKPSLAARLEAAPVETAARQEAVPGVPEGIPAAALSGAGRPVSARPWPAPARISGRQRRVNPLDSARVLASEREWGRAIEIYDSLYLADPVNLALGVERARVLAWSGNPGAGAKALGLALASETGDPVLRLEQANYFWWAADFARADSVLWLAEGIPSATVDSLRTLIRQGADPDVDLARRWLTSRSTGLEYLLVARSLAHADRGGEAVPYYREALRLSAVPDSVVLEMASVATASDSLVAAIEALEHYLDSQPGDWARRVQLARDYSWSGRTEEARREYGTALRASDDPELRFELAQLLSWSGLSESAEIELRNVLLGNPRHVGALKLLGDIALWRGDWEEALASYDAVAASDPGVDGLPESIAAANLLRLAAKADLPSRHSWQVAMESFGDSETFSWFAARASHTFTNSSGSVQVAVERTSWDGAASAGAAQPGSGFGADVTGSANVSKHVAVSGQLGARSLGGSINQPTWGAKVSYAPGPARSLVLEYTHQPALRRAATVAAWYGRTVSDLLQLTASRPVLGLDIWSRGEVERFGSTGGQTSRIAGTVAVSRPLALGLSASGIVSGLTTDGPSPTLADWGPLYWSPLSYASATVGLGYANTSSERWRATARVAPGYVWVRERNDFERRFPATRAAVLGLSGEASYLVGGWQLGLSADWNGAIEEGYRAAVVRFQLSQALGAR